MIEKEARERSAIAFETRSPPNSSICRCAVHTAPLTVAGAPIRTCYMSAYRTGYVTRLIQTYVLSLIHTTVVTIGSINVPF